MSDYNIPAKEHRANARKALGGNIFSTNWLMGLLVVLIYSLIIGAASTVSSGIATIVISGPFMLGLAGCFLAIVRNGSVKVENLFDGFKNDFLQSFLLGLMTSIFTFLWSLLFIIPGIVKAYAYSMAWYIKHDNPSYDWKQCMDESQRLMMGKKWNLFCLDLSFIGWIIVSALICGIGVLWIEPYMQAARASFYESLLPKHTQYTDNQDFNVSTDNQI